MVFIDTKKEWTRSTELKGSAGRYFAIPLAFIQDKSMDEKRIAIFSYFAIRRGLDSMVQFSIISIVKWLGKKPDNHKNGINGKIREIIDSMEKENYIINRKYAEKGAAQEAEFNLERISELNNKERFALLYLDEIDKIMNYENPKWKDLYCNNDTLLLVFAYLRAMIFRRKNKLLPEEIGCDNKASHAYDVEQRRRRTPEAFDCYYMEIGDEVGLSARVVSKAVETLCEIGLIYAEELPRIRYIDGNKERWKTAQTIFCNTYRREGSELLASGKDYYMTEVKNKKEKIAQFMKKWAASGGYRYENERY